MQLKIGSYAFTANSCWVTVRREFVLNEADIPYVERIELDIEGFLFGTGQSDLTTKENALVTMIESLQAAGKDVSLNRDDGKQSGVYLRHRTSLTGVLCMRGPSFGEKTGAEYAVQRKYSFTLRADYPIINTRTALISFSEKMDFSGGGPVYIYKDAINGPPQKQLSVFQKPYQLIQSGEAYGFLAYPRVPPPAFPECLMQEPEIGKITPNRSGDTYKKFGMKWSYVMQSVAPLFAVPTLWR